MTWALWYGDGVLTRVGISRYNFWCYLVTLLFPCPLFPMVFMIGQ
jgi:hypothetical protein